DECKPCERRGECDVVAECLRKLDRLQRGRVGSGQAAEHQLQAGENIESVGEVSEGLGVSRALNDGLEELSGWFIVLEKDEGTCQIDRDDRVGISLCRTCAGELQCFVAAPGQLERPCKHVAKVR